ncbi:MAG: hypothetical protein QOH16_2807 [Gaiellaceae bacterium]|jgi:hypothetical protein|nr:hypothetical protein [Gaiellaceae bacterium]
MRRQATKRILIVCVALAVISSSLLITSASAHNRDRWYWNKYSAETRLQQDGIEWSDGTASGVLTALCFGRGDAMASKNPNKPLPLYRHFRCHGTTDDGNTFSVLLHVTGQYTYVLTEY